ncbi:odorant receptor 13a-like isoform X2 [Megachile rotundata]|uniref:odorant receptor 13a-like isoform X2 n=1 Tax=Megachile rotundata TaxID=143995 RepID=UPI003FD4B3CB
MNQSLQPNLNYENDIIYVTKYSRWILMSIGIWPGSLKGSAKFLSKIAIGFGNLVLFFAIIPFSLHIVLEQKDTVIMLKMLGFLSFCLISVLKYWALAMRKPKIERCIELMQTDWKQVEFRRNRHMMLKYGKVGRDLTILCIVFMYSGGTIYHTIMQYAIGSFIDEHNRTIKPLVYPTYSALYDVQKIHVYVLVYTVHCMCGYVIYSVTAGACGLAALFATHTCGQIDIVLNRLNGLVDGNLMRHDDLNERLIEIVEHHLRTLRFSAMMETVLQEVCFLEFVGSTFMICLLEYYTIVDWKQSNTIGLTTYTLLLISLTFNIFILCYIGDLLIEKSTSIGTSSFEIDWYRLPTKTIRGLILIIAMSNNPVKISAGGIVTLSLSTFVNVLKSSLGYLSFLRTVVV